MTNALMMSVVPGWHCLLKDCQKRIFQALLGGGQQQAHVVYRQSEPPRGCRQAHQWPQARPLEGIDRTLALPLLHCRPTGCLGFLSLVVSPADPSTLGGDDAGISLLSLCQRIGDNAAHGLDLSTSPPHQREKMETTTRDQFGIADLLSSRQSCLEFLIGLLELACQK